ncbi:MAG: hypothetical protein HWE39_12720 [Oceanospirillaceae bacterium]|nr:hypothetical protein [Oceanospirillaceae bacterium]
MKPFVSVFTKNKKLENQVHDRYLEVVRFDRPGTSSDMIEIHLDDRDGKVITPEHGTLFTLYIGYEERLQVNQGTYILDRSEFSGPPDKVVFYASALNIREAMGGHKSRRWDNTTPAVIVNAIASENGYTAVVDDVYETIQIQYLAQQEQSDIEFLRDLAKQYGAMFKAQGSVLVFIAQGANKSEAIKNKLGRFTIRKKQCSNYRVGREDISRYTGVRAKWNDLKTPSGLTEYVLVGSEDKVFVLPDLYQSRDEAKLAAQAKLDRLIRSEADVSITIPGNPSITCESELELIEFRDRVNDLYVVTEVEHRISKDTGYQSRVKALLAVT